MLYIPLPVGRICRKCGTWKPYAELKKHKAHLTGVDALCHQCHAGQSQKRYNERREEMLEWQRQYRRDHLEEMREREKRRRDNPAQRQRRINYGKRYYAENKERLNEKSRKYAKEHPEVSRKSGKKWAAANRDKVNARNRHYQKRHPENAAKHVKLSRQRHPETKRASDERRRARKRNLPNNFTAEDWRNCLNYWHGCCAVCGRPAGLWHTIAADHWIPLGNPSCPGTVPTNMLPLCHSQRLGDEGCNNTKWKLDPVEWLEGKMDSKRKAAAKLREIEAFFATVRK